ncbi:hypothetical protein E4P39_03295 [Blastococcus sp. CT_GayMR19]|jgi:hypothetical protein|uniref:hypothetical protein n=1 Tax=Blastococcus sp. CT_GayMR19 TaxID=2559608 RepID=UPI001073DFE7|nr:hypothetical protein [Blastococcus sp. CT_GayMR19]TFV78265.1 hypothetical protein E4P39_03295 [Blastococcus sp. CT_GayMR19]
MTAIRRLPVIIGLTMAVLIGSVIPASATFGDSAAVATEIKTTRVEAPTSVVGTLKCNAPTGTTATMGATWKASTTPRISGYRVKVYFSDGFVQTVELGPSATSWSAQIGMYYVTAFTVEYSVTTVTDYGWFTESAKTGQFRC